MKNIAKNPAKVTGSWPGQAAILTPDALDFLALLGRKFAPRVADVLARRAQRQARIDSGALPDFRPESEEIRQADWRARAAPAGLRERRVDLFGPAEPRSMLDGLSSGASVFVADIEDSLAPAWNNVMLAQAAIRDAVAGNLALTDDGEPVALPKEAPRLAVCPRGLHLPEKHLLVDDRPLPAALFDVGTYLFHNAAPLAAAGSGPHVWLAKLESSEEAGLWNDVFRFVEEQGVADGGSISASVLIETVPAAFEMDEILFELKDYACALGWDPRDYVFSFVRTFRSYPEFALPDRESLTASMHFLNACSRLLVEICRRRGVAAIGSDTPRFSVRDDRDGGELFMTRVRADKERQRASGYHATSVSQLALVPLALELFGQDAGGPVPLRDAIDDRPIVAADLLYVVKGKITERGLRRNVSLALRYLVAWLGGEGSLRIHGLLVDAATAEIARAQLWQWVHHDTGILEDGRVVTYELFNAVLSEEAALVRAMLDLAESAGDRLDRATALLDAITRQDGFESFLTGRAYAEMA